MPSGSHKFRRSQDTKKKKPKTFITDSDGWTHVARNGPPAPAPTASDLAYSFHTLNLDDNDSNSITVDQIANSQKRYDRIWRSSESWSRLSALLQDSVLRRPTTAEDDTTTTTTVTSTTTATPPINLTKCICLGLGSLTSTRDAPRYELAALYTILELLQPHHPSLAHSNNLTFQDPAFAPADIAFLVDHSHHRVVTSPAAFAEIDANTFLFAPHLEHDVLATALRAASAMPGMCIANGDLVLDGTPGKNLHGGGSSGDLSAKQADPQRATLRAFVNAMEARPLPAFDRDTWCHFTWLYWRCEDQGRREEEAAEESGSVRPV